MDADDLVPALEKVDLFQGLSPKIVRRIAASGRAEAFGPGETVIEQGEAVSGWHAFSPKGVEFHVILAGSAEVTVGDQVKRTLEEGAYFGELSLIDGKPRSAEVAAGQQGLTTFAMSKWQFEVLLEDHPAVAISMLRVLAGRLRAAEQARS